MANYRKHNQSLRVNSFRVDALAQSILMQGHAHNATQARELAEYYILNNKT